MYYHQVYYCELAGVYYHQVYYCELAGVYYHQVYYCELAGVYYHLETVSLEAWSQSETVAPAAASLSVQISYIRNRTYIERSRGVCMCTLIARIVRSQVILTFSAQF